jgi:hypothetical protein
MKNDKGFIKLWIGSMNKEDIRHREKRENWRPDSGI